MHLFINLSFINPLGVSHQVVYNFSLGQCYLENFHWSRSVGLAKDTEGFDIAVCDCMFVML